jgi:hypothetical protein
MSLCVGDFAGVMEEHGRVSHGTNQSNIGTCRVVSDTCSRWMDRGKRKIRMKERLSFLYGEWSGEAGEKLVVVQYSYEKRWI